MIFGLEVQTTQAAAFTAATEAELATTITTANGDGVADTITLTAALPDITSVITIEGGGFTLERDAGIATNFSVLAVTVGSNLTVNQMMTLKHDPSILAQITIQS